MAFDKLCSDLCGKHNYYKAADEKEDALLA